MLMIDDVIVHTDILTECFVCDIASCQGCCCEEGDAGAPVTMDEIADIEAHLDEIWGQLSASAQAVIDRQGVAYADPEGELVTSIVGRGNCVFRGPRGCLLPRRPISCHLYPIREKRFNGGLVGINYHRWDICRAATVLGESQGTPLYIFLREPLVRRFGQAWYDELCEAAKLLLA
ncbi:MAG: DUF3109 family protein [Bacteroidaceae bacterium]|nr:DUF3109 family protein [Bacteroidaceae bacterium]